MAKSKKPAGTAKRNVVQVSAASKPAAEEPIFLIDYKGKLYLTAAVLEYDPKAKAITKEQARAMKEMFKLLEGADCVRATPLKRTQSGSYSGANTFPMAFSGANTDPKDVGEGGGDDDDP